MSLLLHRTEAERATRQIIKCLRRHNNEWTSEPTLNNLSPLLVTALLKYLVAQDKNRIKINILFAVILLIWVGSLAIAYHDILIPFVVPLWACHALLALLREDEKRYATYALTQTKDLRALEPLIKATREPYGQHPEILRAIKCLIAQITEEHIGLLNSNVQVQLWKLAVEPIYTLQYLEVDFALPTLKALAHIGNRAMFIKMQRLTHRTGKLLADRRVIEAAQQLVPLMEARLQRQEVPETLLRAASAPGSPSDVLLRAAQFASAEPSGQLLRASMLEERET